MCNNPVNPRPAISKHRNLQSVKVTRKFHWVFCFVIFILFCSCSSTGIVDESQKRIEDEQFAKERQRIEAEKRAEYVNVTRELVARNLPAKTSSESIWQQFRSTYPFHNQTLALSPPASDQSQTLIVSEPPPQTTIEDILYPLKNVLLNHSVKKQTIGYDGWVKDVIIAVKGSDQDITSALSSLNHVLFQTSYKAYITPLPASTPARDAYKLDLQVTANELKTWVIDENEKFIRVESLESVNATDIFSRPDCGVYSAESKGIVAWWIPKEKMIQNCKIQARQFSLDSDLVIGALAKNGGTVVFGRERIIPLDILPPLRVEMIELLASVQNGGLKQSYNRNHILAGRVGGNKDWAPIELSPELVDTEYGSLLNITDQLLKGWSNNGNTTYENFKYPRPAKMPFAVPLNALLKVSKVTYNWNTEGAGYIVDTRDYQIMALNRTGALSVSYIPEGIETFSPKVINAENNGYDYFAGLSDSNLVRVVQYAALYQIFKAFDVKGDARAIPSSRTPETVLATLTEEIYDEIKNSSDQELMTLSQRILAQIPAGISPNYRYLKNIKWHLEQLSNGYDSRESLSEATLDGYKYQDDFDQQVQLNWMVASLLSALKKLPERYAEEVEQQSEIKMTWIHTPVVVMSKNSNFMSVGGHNLDARVTSYKFSDDIAVGKPSVNSKGEIWVNPRDAAKLSRTVREAGRNYEDASKMQDLLAKSFSDAPEIALRPASVALDLQTVPPISKNDGFNFFSKPSSTETINEKLVTGWGRFKSQPAMSESDLTLFRESNQISDGSIVIAKHNDGAYHILINEKSSALKAFTAEDASDMVVNLMQRNVAGDKNALKLNLHNFENQEATVFIRSCEIRAANGKIPREIDTFIHSKNASNEAIAEMRNAKYNFSKAEFKTSEIEVLSNGYQRAKIEIEVPLFETGVKQGRTTIEFQFSKSTPREIISLFLKRIAEAISKLKGELNGKIDAMRFNRMMSAEISRIKRETGVDVEVINLQFDEGMGDIHFARINGKDEFTEPGATGGHAA